MAPYLKTVHNFIFAIVAAAVSTAAPVFSEPVAPGKQPVIMGEKVLNNLDAWVAELERPGQVTVGDGVMDIDVPAGATIWLKERLSGPVKIRYEAMAVSAGGPNDRVSDLNCFWMARDARNMQDLLQVTRNGAFAEYDQLQCYYVGLGGNGNTTTRFRRYIGARSNRPLLADHDRKEPLIVPNEWHAIELIADGENIRYLYDGKAIFELRDTRPYVSGWFGLRTVSSHLKIRKFEIVKFGTTTRPAASQP